jgi:kinesin family member 15
VYRSHVNLYSFARQTAQRTEEVRGFKMRLRFREDQIRRLEQVASGKLSAEAHLLQEKEDLRKELEVLRGQLDRNPEITKFAMENLQLKEDLQRLAMIIVVNDGNKSLYLVFVGVVFSQHLELLLEQLGQQHLDCFVRTAGQRHLDCF